MGKLYVLCGIAGSGKSTFALDYILKNRLWAHRVSTDEIRKELYGDEACQKDPKKVFQIAYDEIYKWLPNNDVVFDATNISRSFRKKLINAFREYADELICIYFVPNVELAIKRDRGRSRSVGSAVIRRQAEQLEVPTKEEGWDCIMSIDPALQGIGELDTCVLCGAYVVEGTHVCPMCKKKWGVTEWEPLLRE